MSPTVITNTPNISVVVGAYYKVFLNGSEADPKPEKTYSALVGYQWTYCAPVVRTRSLSIEDSQKFDRLVAEWHRERAAASAVMNMVLCPAYQKIIAMGGIAIPLILARLRAEGNEPDHWFWALRIITEENPVSDDDRGQIVNMAQAWLRWGETKGYAG